MVNRLCFLLFVLITTSAFGDDLVRDVQEELRRRNMYFGDVDGKVSPELTTALKRYQARKGFATTGVIDETTTASLDVKTATPIANKAALPEVTILKSDTARELEEAQRVRLAQQAEENPDPETTPVPPAEEPPPSQNLTRETVQNLVTQYLRDGEGTDIPAQTRYFAYPVDYFQHGPKGPAFVEKDVANYCKRWPQRKYALIGPVTFAASENADETNIEFSITFEVRNQKYTAAGKTKNTWKVRAEGEELKIVAIHEQRLRE